jgi:hypothetical protein
MSAERVLAGYRAAEANYQRALQGIRQGWPGEGGVEYTEWANRVIDYHETVLGGHTDALADALAAVLAERRPVDFELTDLGRAVTG